MRTLKKNWSKLVGAITLASLVVYACISVWGQTAPGLRIAVTGTNQVTITVTNAVTNAQYQLYYREFLDTNSDWLFLTGGAVGQSNFPVNIGDTVQGFFQATYNPGFTPPTITVIIQSPLNGSVIQ